MANPLRGFGLVLLVGLLVITAGRGVNETPPPKLPNDSAAPVSQHPLRRAQRAIERNEYHIRRQPANYLVDAPERYQAPNRVQGVVLQRAMIPGPHAGRIPKGRVRARLEFET